MGHLSRLFLRRHFFRLRRARCSIDHPTAIERPREPSPVASDRERSTVCRRRSSIGPPFDRQRTRRLVCDSLVLCDAAGRCRAPLRIISAPLSGSHEGDTPQRIPSRRGCRCTSTSPGSQDSSDRCGRAQKRCMLFRNILERYRSADANIGAGHVALQYSFWRRGTGLT